jgi:tetratricopeptide (TPR) repeat protein
MMSRWGRGRNDGANGATAGAWDRAQRALAEGRYDLALATLHRAAEDSRDRRLQAQAHVHLAACYALYGPEGLDGGWPALRTAVAADPTLADDPLYQALYWEFEAYRGAPASDVKRGLRSLPPALPAMAGYHRAAALLSVGASTSALRRLRTLASEGLPAYLVWRRDSLLGQAHEALGHWQEAADAYRRASSAAPASERDPELLAHASCLLELGRYPALLEALAEVDEERIEPLDLSQKRYLEGRAHLEADNPNLALEHLRQARRLIPVAEQDFSLPYASGQALMALQRPREALVEFEQAIAIAPAEHRAYAQHEAAMAHLEAENPEAAVPLLEAVVADPGYPHRAEALADLADLHLRAGELDNASLDAERALELGAVGPACLVLGGVAFEYFRLDEAVRWYEQALAASQAGDSVWLAAHQLLADVHGQRGPAAAAQALWHAQAALAYTDAASDWRLPLEEHVTRSRALLGGHDRLLN